MDNSAVDKYYIQHRGLLHSELGQARLLTAPTVGVTATAGAGHTVPMVTQAVEEVTAKVERINKYFGFRIKLFTRCTFCVTYTTY